MMDQQAGSLALIASAAYVSTEIAAEYGNLPPSFLPFGHGRLFETQTATLAEYAERVVLTVPASFTINPVDATWLAKKNVEVLRVPDGVTLSESIAFAILNCGEFSALTLLHGDTLVPDAPHGKYDCIAVATPQRCYQWGHLSLRESHRDGAETAIAAAPTEILAGWFSFSNPRIFLDCLEASPTDFVRALERYDKKFRLLPIRSEDWLDFGHLHTFHLSRTKIDTARSFNDVSMDRRTVKKTGTNRDKIEAEARWFENLPLYMRLFTPAYLGRVTAGYRLAYEFSPNLHELYIFGCVGPRAWQEIASGCMDFLSTCANHISATEDRPGQSVLDDLVVRKTNDRLETWARQSKIKLDRGWTVNGRATPCLYRILEEVIEVALQSVPIHGIMHGDLCFPNMFYDYRQQTIKVIDPRGSVIDGKPSNYGDLRYDLAKLNHSVQGYDAILARRYSLKRLSDYSCEFELATTHSQEYFISGISEYDLNGIKIGDKSNQALTVLLFLSMLPLHSDRPDRQSAFLANALRLYQMLD